MIPTKVWNTGRQARESRGGKVSSVFRERRGTKPQTGKRQARLEEGPLFDQAVGMGSYDGRKHLQRSIYPSKYPRMLVDWVHDQDEREGFLPHLFVHLAKTAWQKQRKASSFKARHANGFCLFLLFPRLKKTPGGKSSQIAEERETHILHE